MRWPLSLVVFALFFLASVSAQDPKDKKPNGAPWSILSIWIAQSGGVLGMPSSLDGTKVTGLLHLPDHFIVGIDAGNSKLNITDDKNNDLLDKSAEERREVVREARISKDAKYSSIQFHAHGLPAKEASRIRIKGTVAVVVAKDEKEIEKKDVALGGKVKLEIGTLRSAKTSSLSGRDNFLVYTGPRPLKRIVVLDSDGKEITYRHVPSYESRPGAKDEFRTNLHSSTTKKLTLDRCTLRLTYFETVERLNVPIDIEVGLGF